MTAPRLYISGEPTNACKMLREIAKASPDGMDPKNLPPRGGFPAVSVRSSTASSLLKVGWITMKPVGPRGGKRYFVTDMGAYVLKCVDEDGMYYVRSLWLAYPEMVDELRRLGKKPKRTF